MNSTQTRSTELCSRRRDHWVAHCFSYWRLLLYTFALMGYALHSRATLSRRSTTQKGCTHARTCQEPISRHSNLGVMQVRTDTHCVAVHNPL